MIPTQYLGAMCFNNAPLVDASAVDNRCNNADAKSGQVHKPSFDGGRPFVVLSMKRAVVLIYCAHGGGIEEKVLRNIPKDPSIPKRPEVPGLGTEVFTFESPWTVGPPGPCVRIVEYKESTHI